MIIIIRDGATGHARYALAYPAFPGLYTQYILCICKRKLPGGWRIVETERPGIRERPRDASGEAATGAGGSRKGPSGHASTRAMPLIFDSIEQ